MTEVKKWDLVSYLKNTLILILSKAVGSAGKLRQKLERDRQDRALCNPHPYSLIYLSSDLRS